MWVTPSGPVRRVSAGRGGRGSRRDLSAVWCPATVLPLVVTAALLMCACEDDARERDSDDPAPSGGVAAAGGAPAVGDAEVQADAAAPADAGAPTLSLAVLRPSIQVRGGPVEILGEGIHDPDRAVGEPAGADVQLVKGPDARAAVNVTVQPDNRGLQALRFEVPTRDGTPWGTREVVDVVVTFKGQSASLPFEYDDP